MLLRGGCVGEFREDRELKEVFGYLSLNSLTSLNSLKSYKRYMGITAVNSLQATKKRSQAKPNSPTINSSLRLLLLNQRDAALDEVREHLAFEHTIREQRKVDNLTHQFVLCAYLSQAGVAFVTQQDNLS